jgi:3D (Asp-Asp-Asp) domain-containing protein
VKLDHAALRGQALWGALVIRVCGVAQRAGLRDRLMGMGLPPRMTARRLLLAAIVLTPSILYMVERYQHGVQVRGLETLALFSASEAGLLRSSLDALLDERARLREILLDDGRSVHMGDDVMVKVVATGYSSTIRETDHTPFITASNTATREGILALSRDLLKRYTPGAPFDFGDRVHVPGLGEFIVEDAMNSRWNNRIDVWFPSTDAAKRFGVKEVYLRTVDTDLTLPGNLSENEPAGTVTGM